LGKKKIISEEEIKDMVLPVANDELGTATRLLGFDRVLMKCQDGHERLCRIRGKMKRRVWIRIGGIVLVSPGVSNLTNVVTLYGVTKSLRLKSFERTDIALFNEEGYSVFSKESG